MWKVKGLNAGNMDLMDIPDTFRNQISKSALKQYDLLYATPTYKNIYGWTKMADSVGGQQGVVKST